MLLCARRGLCGSGAPEFEEGCGDGEDDGAEDESGDSEEGDAAEDADEDGDGVGAETGSDEDGVEDVVDGGDYEASPDGEECGFAPVPGESEV
jgi:hypothetical protein